MLCTNCSADSHTGSNFCHSCGARIVANIRGPWLVVYWGLPLLPIPVALLIVGPTFEPILGGLFFSALIMAMASGTPRTFVLEPHALVVYWRFRLKRYDYARMRIEDRDFTWDYVSGEWSPGSSNLVLVHPELWPSRSAGDTWP